MDNKKLVCFVLLASVPGVSHADGFFINTGLGETNFYPQIRYLALALITIVIVLTP